MDKVSVVVPVFNEEKTLPNFLNQMEGLSADEVVLVDGGSRDQTGDILQKWSKAQSGRCRRVLSSASKGRANQMNEGGREATGDILLFLHADSTFPPNGVDAILEALHPSSVVGGAFCLKIDSPVFFLKVVSMMANLRSRFLNLPYGDQGYFVRRDLFLKLGGYRAMPLMEDIDFIRRLKKVGRVVLLKESVTTSPRRWLQEGYFYTSFRNFVLFILYYLGVSPLRLAKWYYS